MLMDCLGARLVELKTYVKMLPSYRLVTSRRFVSKLFRKRISQIAYPIGGYFTAPPPSICWWNSPTTINLFEKTDIGFETFTTCFGKDASMEYPSIAAATMATATPTAISLLYADTFFPYPRVFGGPKNNLCFRIACSDFRIPERRNHTTPYFSYIDRPLV